MHNLSDLIGRTIFEYTLNRNEDEITFLFTDGFSLHLWHTQDCCESVTIEDIEGDLEDLVGRPLFVCEEVSNDDPNASESGTWTFYRFATEKGYVTVRWYGTSNGYYSESVNSDISFSDAVWESGSGWRLREKLSEEIPQLENNRARLKI